MSQNPDSGHLQRKETLWRGMGGGWCEGLPGIGSILLVNVNGDDPGAHFMCICFRHFSAGRLHLKRKNKLTEMEIVPWSRQGWGVRPTCPIFHVLHLHDFCVDSTPEDVEGAIDGFGPLGGFLAPGDPGRQRDVPIPCASTTFSRAKGRRAVALKDATPTSSQGREVHRTSSGHLAGGW